MIKQTLTFRSAVSLSVKNKQLVIRMPDDDTVATRPIEDIGVIIIENQMVKITMPCINELSDNNVALIICDAHSMPKSMLMTLDGNTTLQETYRFQIDASQPAKKQIWKQIVESKIRNQANLLYKLGLDGDTLKPLYMNVKSGDGDNREGAAARAYWNMLYGDTFHRQRIGEAPNSLLNYGYTILRAAAARALLGSGLYPAFGVFHRNRYNAFPLADDIMEPYRPFVDEIVYSLFLDGSEELSSETKSILQRVLFVDVGMGNSTRPLEVALSMTTASLAKALKGDVQKLTLPVLQ